MTAVPSISQREAFVVASLDRAHTYLAHEGVRRMLGWQTVTMLESRLDQAVIPEMANLPDGSGVEVSLDQAGDSRQAFPMIGVLPGEKIVYSPLMTTQADDVVHRQVARLRDIDPSLDDERALDLLILREGMRRQQDVVTADFDHGYCAQVLAEHGTIPLTSTRARIYQQPLAVFAMQDVRGTSYTHAHPVVTTHETVHLDDFSELSVVDERVAQPHEFSLATELRAHRVSALGERAVEVYGLDASGLWYRSIYPNRPTVSSRVEALRQAHTTLADPFQPLPSLYLALEHAGLQSIY